MQSQALLSKPRRLTLERRLLVIALGALACAAARADSQPLEGFGAETPGGHGKAVVRVTTLADSGPGSLREAISGGDRTVVFDVAGEIQLERQLNVQGSFVTIDGSTAPAPGVTLRNRGLYIRGALGAHDVIVRGLRVRDAEGDGITVAQNAHHVVIDHVSVHGSGDGNIDVTHGARDVTICWCLLAAPASQKSMLIKYGASRVTLHHNLFIRGETRNPQAGNGDVGGFTPAIETTLDLRNNVIGAWAGGYGTSIRDGARANVVNNYYAPLGGDKRDMLMVEQARAFVRGNVSADRVPFDLNDVNTEETPFDAPVVRTTTAEEAAREVWKGAGVRPLDRVDRESLAGVSLPVPGGDR
jgi:pectate lyase